MEMRTHTRVTRARARKIFILSTQKNDLIHLPVDMSPGSRTLESTGRCIRAPHDHRAGAGRCVNLLGQTYR